MTEIKVHGFLYFRVPQGFRTTKERERIREAAGRVAGLSQQRN